MLAELILASNIGYDKPIDNTSAYCMAEAVYFEARDQPIEGQAAVAVTIINRVESEKFPDTICEVVYQSKQFSYTLLPLKEHRDTINPVNPFDKLALQLSVQISLQALADGFEGMHNALHYYNPSVVNPKWAKSFKESFEIKDHKWVY